MDTETQRLAATISEHVKGMSSSEKDSVISQLRKLDISELFDLAAVEATAEDFRDYVKGAFRNYGIFCCSADSNNLLMWAHYAEQHRGAVIELTPSIERDSPLLLLKEVVYDSIRPALYNVPSELLIHQLSMSSQQSAKLLFDKLVYTKSTEWSYEKEYRLTIPDYILPSENYRLLHLNPGELSSIYLGCRMDEGKVDLVKTLASSLNVKPSLFKSVVNARDFKIDYVELEN